MDGEFVDGEKPRLVLLFFLHDSIGFQGFFHDCFLNLSNGVPMDARYLLHAGNRKALGEQRWNLHRGPFGASRSRTSVRIEFRNRFLTARTPEAVSLEEDSAPGIWLHRHRP